MPCPSCRSGLSLKKMDFKLKPPEKLIQEIIGCKSYSICNRILSASLPHELQIHGNCQEQVEIALGLFLESILPGSNDKILKAEQIAYDWFVSRALFVIVSPQSRFIYKEDSIFSFEVFLGNIRNTIGFSPISTVVVPCWRYDLAVNEIKISFPHVTESSGIGGDCEWM